MPACAEHVEETTLRLLRDYELDFYKLDYNSAIGEGGQRERDGYLECESWRHYEVINHLSDRVGKEFPDVALKNCASGGGRSDLNMLSRFHYTCTGDFSCPPYGIHRSSSTSSCWTPTHPSIANEHCPYTYCPAAPILDSRAGFRVWFSRESGTSTWRSSRVDQVTGKAMPYGLLYDIARLNDLLDDSDRRILSSRSER